MAETVAGGADPLIEVTGLCKSFGSSTVVDDVTFSVRPGQSLAIVGESGSGKTTIARMLVGLEPADAGSIVACGNDRSRPATTLKERRRRGREVQMVFQDAYSSLDRRQTVEQAIGEVVRLHSPSDTASMRRSRVTELIDMVGLDKRAAGSVPGVLSGGQRQRVSIARALAADPKAIILDESVAALDVSIQAQVLNLLADIGEELGVSYLLISHDLAVVRQMTQDTLVLHRGTIVEEGPTGRVLDNPQHPYTQRLRASVPVPGWTPPRR